MSAARLVGRVAIVTGGGSGIGRATAKRLALEGARVVVGDIREEAAQEVADEIRATGGEAIAQRVDVAAEEEVKLLVERTTEAFGRLDVLHSNAGVLLPGSVTELSLADWRRTLDVNLTGAFLLCREAIPAMLAGGGGSIILTSSVSGIVAEPAIAAYCATKGALVMLAKQMAVDYARDGIRVNAICPGWIDTPFNDPVIERSGGRDSLQPWIDAMVPMGRQGTPDEVADAVLFLACEESRLMTGHALVVDAGLTAQ